MYYEKINKNKKEWIVLIHGIGGSTQTWKKQVDDFSEKFNLILVDLDGHGNSDANLEIIHKVDNDADNIKEILDKEKIKKIHIMSLSLGTLVALEFIRKYPEYVLSNILTGCIVNLDKKRKFVLGVAQKVKYYLPKSIMFNIFALILLPRNNHKKSRKIFVRESKKMNKNSFLCWINEIDECNKKVNEYVNCINKNKIKTLFIMGQEDYFFKKGIENLKNKINDLKIKIIDNCGHICNIEKYSTFNNIALDFYKNKEI